MNFATNRLVFGRQCTLKCKLVAKACPMVAMTLACKPILSNYEWFNELNQVEVDMKQGSQYTVKDMGVDELRKILHRAINSV